MAAKHGRGEIDWESNIRHLMEAVSRKQLIEGESLKIAIDKIGLDGWLAVLTPEQRREVAKRIETESK